MSEIFKFKQFALNQEGAAMKMGTDAMLLGCLAEPYDAQNILDIGTGTGVLSLMLAQRCPDAIVDAVEIDKNAADCAQANFTNSPWAYRLTLYHEDITRYTNTDVILYEYIVCNPPYFEPSPTTREDRIHARSTVALTHELLIEHAEKLLDGRGTFGIILPEQECEKVIELAKQKGLLLKREVLVSSFKNSPTIRRVLEFSKTKADTTVQQSLYIYNEDKSWSEEYTALTQDFHLLESR